MSIFCLRIGMTILSFSCCGILSAQTRPVISSFSPLSGVAGSKVSISGANFDPSSARNIVYFGAAKAKVITASATQLVVAVPIGATVQPIMITTEGTGLMGSSSTSFIIKPPTAEIDENSFGKMTSFQPGRSPMDLAVGDFDNDGRNDVAVLNANSNNFTAHRNVNEKTAIEQNSFVDGVSFPLGLFPRGIATGDLDGDGKLDIAAVVDNAAVVVLRNASVSGSISFEAGVSYSIGTIPISVNITDIDGDGRNEIITTSLNDKAISILRNLSNPGPFSAASFAPKMTLPTGGFPSTVVTGDLDHDNKPDMVVSNGQTLAIYKNLSSPGSISLGVRIDIPGLFPTSNYKASIGDLDGDGNQDIAVGISGVTNTAVVVFRNTSVLPGSLDINSFSSRTDLPGGTIGQGPQQVSMYDFNGDGKLDLGYINSNRLVSVYKNVGSPEAISVSSFEPTLDYKIGAVPKGFVVCDLNGDKKPEIVVATEGDPMNGTNGLTVLSTLSFSQNTDVIIYPNPVKNDLVIDLTDFEDLPSDVTIFDMSGKRLGNWVVNGGAVVSLEVKGYAIGAYVIKVVQQQRSSSKIFIKI